MQLALCHRVIAPALLITMLFGAGCRTVMSQVQSPFFSKFSLRELFEKNEFSAGLDCTEKSGGGGMSAGTGGVGQAGSRFSRVDSIACHERPSELLYFGSKSEREVETRSVACVAGVKHKAWGASPRIQTPRGREPMIMGDRAMYRAFTRIRGLNTNMIH